MKPRRKRRIIRRLNRRIGNIEEALAAYDEVTDDQEVRSKALEWVLDHLEEAGIKLDTNDDGKYSDDELADAAEALEDYLDGLKDLPQPFESLQDIGTSVVVALMLSLITNRRSRLARQLDRNKARLARLQGS